MKIKTQYVYKWKPPLRTSAFISHPSPEITAVNTVVNLLDRFLCVYKHTF